MTVPEDFLVGLAEQAAANALALERLRAEHERTCSVLRELLEAVHEDCGIPADDDLDDEPVGWGQDGPLALTFGILRRAKAALGASE